MTRKDYVAIAAALAASRPTIEQFTTTSAVGHNTFTNSIAYNAADVGWTAAVIGISNALEADNPRFDRARFQAAATLTADDDWTAAVKARVARGPVRPRGPFRPDDGWVE